MTTQEKIKDIIGGLEIKRTPYITSIVLNVVATNGNSAYMVIN